MNRRQTAHFEEGTEEEITLVLSCPGACEELKGKPAAGKSGENLEGILEEVNKLTGTGDWTREKVTITNAWDKIEHECKTGRTEAKISEIKSSENLKRLFCEVKQTRRYIVCFGDKAQKAIQNMMKPYSQNKIETQPKIINVRHPSLQSLNQISEDIHGKAIVKKQKDATQKRIEVVAHDLFNQLELTDTDQMTTEIEVGK